jgi:hypothetical protein
MAAAAASASRRALCTWSSSAAAASSRTPWCTAGARVRSRVRARAWHAAARGFARLHSQPRSRALKRAEWAGATVSHLSAGVEYIYDRARDWQDRVKIRLLPNMTYDAAVQHLGRLVQGSGGGGGGGGGGGVRLAVLPEVEAAPAWAAHRLQDCLWAGLACVASAPTAVSAASQPSLVPPDARGKSMYGHAYPSPQSNSLCANPRVGMTSRNPNHLNPNLSLTLVS